MLTFVEEIVLLALDDKKGKFVDLPPLALDQALAGAALLELAFQNRIDTDLTHLTLVSDKATGDKMLDPILREIAGAKDKKDAKYWVGVISADGEKIRDAALARLVERGVLKQEEKKFLWVIPGRRYPMIQTSRCDDTTHGNRCARVVCQSHLELCCRSPANITSDINVLAGDVYVIRVLGSTLGNSTEWGIR